MSIRNNVIRVDLKQLTLNAMAIKSALNPGTLLMAVVKAEAYGHGMLKAARAFQKAGAEYFGVAIAEEGIGLREAGFSEPILVFGPAVPEAVEACVRFHLTQTIMDAQMVKWIDSTARRLQVRAPVHVKIDTGMNRIGLRGEKALSEVRAALQDAKNVAWTGIYTHFADADAPDTTFTQGQLNAFLDLTKGLPGHIIRHAAASAAALRDPGTHLDMVRPGIALYGCTPVRTNLPIRPAMAWTTEVDYLKTVPAGESISYGRTHTVTRDSLVATLPVGYGDGYHRFASNRGRVLIGGEYAPILGRVCMDQMMVDVTGIKEVRLGSEAVLLGTQGGKSITPEDLGESFGTICYEALLAPSPRVRREWVNG